MEKKQKKQKTRTPQERGKASRAKGKRQELAISHAFKDAGYSNAHRSQQYCGRGHETGDVSGVDGLSIEVKAYAERLNYLNAYKQSCESAKAGDIPIVVAKKDREKEPLVLIGLKDFIRVYKAYAPPEGGDADGK